MRNVNEMLTYLFSELKDGVEYKRLGDITEILRGRRLTKKELTDNAEYPVYHGGIEPIGYYSHHNRPANTVMIINVGASAGTVGYCNKPFWSSDGCYCIDKSELLSDRYLYYVLSKNQLAFVSKVRHAGIPTLDSKVIANFEIPVPPIEVQSKIVEILDNFTELEARRKQYEYYRNQLLTFDKVGGARFDVKWMKLGEIFIMKAGKNISAKNIFDSESPQHQYPCFGGNGIRGYVSECNEHGEFPIIGRQGALCGNIQMAKGDFYATEHAVVVKPRIKEVDIRWAYHKLIHMNINQYKTKSAQPGLAVSRIESLEICLPPLSEQQRIVSILDRFETLTTDLQSGLPAEIEARRKQYEYYREKLLTFKRKTA